jgi:hypothetical protein
MNAKRLSRMIALETEDLADRIESAENSGDISYLMPFVTKIRKDLSELGRAMKEYKGELDNNGK